MNRYSKDLNKWLQWELNAHGFECDIDGSFGPTTLKQLKAFQEANGLEPDGSCGPATRKALLK
jgi:peptidoglycan hydrolase-like protein with peptidoglycan-binding domain